MIFGVRVKEEKRKKEKIREWMIKEKEMDETPKKR